MGPAPHLDIPIPKSWLNIHEEIMKNHIIVGILMTVLLVSFTLLCGCTSQEAAPSSTPVVSTSQRGEPVELDVQFKWDKKSGESDVLTAYVTTNIPDGAKLMSAVWEGRHPEELDSKFTMTFDPSIIKDGKTTFTLNLYDTDLGEFTDNTILFNMDFAPWDTHQPQSITEYYEGGALLKIKSGSPGFIKEGATTQPDEKWLIYQAFVTYDGNSSPTVKEVEDYFG